MEVAGDRSPVEAGPTGYPSEVADHSTAVVLLAVGL